VEAQKARTRRSLAGEKVTARVFLEDEGSASYAFKEKVEE
jgi:hypothetical protein